ncbi:MULTISPECIES: hypothetical protein [unclassified Streptomyces]|uniref:hypothetical protein n=1 Tax=unclassified Streptomyces TaxID=2593676 RepID=UPI0036F0887B
MALVEHKLVTTRRKHLANGAAVAAPILAVTLLAGCSSNPSDEAKPTEKPRPSPTASAPANNEGALGRQAKAALGTQSIDDSDHLFVESGLERASDGIHAESPLPRGRSYELSVVCSGKGKVRLSVSLKSPLVQTMDCDGVPVRQRISDSPSTLRIDTSAISGASGMVAWRIDRAAK